MKKISRSAVDVALVQDGVKRKAKLLADVLASETIRDVSLPILLGTATSYAGYLSAAGDPRAQLGKALGIGAQAAAAIFALAGGSGEIEFMLGDRRVRLAATGATSASHVATWRAGWWLAQLVRDQAAIATLAATPMDVLRGSSSRGDACQYMFAEALQAFEQRAADWSEKLHAAIDATDPDKVKLADEEYVLNILVPEMSLLLHLATGNIAPFNEALQFALERHKKYWSKGARKRDPDGYLALGPLALASLASAAGMSISAESEYLPPELYKARV